VVTNVPDGLSRWNAGAVEEAAKTEPEGLKRTRRPADRIGDTALHTLTALAALLGVVVVAAIVWRVADGAWPSVRHFGISFLWHKEWNPVTSHFGAYEFVIGTLVTSFGAMILAAPLSIAIGLFLSELAPAAVRGPVGTLIEMLAAVPSVVIGLWGIYVLAPLMANHVEPALSSGLGWIPIFGGAPSESGMLTAIVVLTIMTIPITSSICRELFLGVPRELEEGAVALGATRWEMVKGVVLPSVKGGVVAAVILGLGRALGEAIAVTQVIGNFIPLHVSLFAPGDTLASRIANQYQGADTNLALHSLIYLGLILLAITFVTNFTAQRVVKRFEFQRAGGD
jgi:phosphate transport system permease protein